MKAPEKVRSLLPDEYHYHISKIYEPTHPMYSSNIISLQRIVASVEERFKTKRVPDGLRHTLDALTHSLSRASEVKEKPQPKEINDLAIVFSAAIEHYFQELVTILEEIDQSIEEKWSIYTAKYNNKLQTLRKDFASKLKERQAKASTDETSKILIQTLKDNIAQIDAGTYIDPELYEEYVRIFGIK